MVSFTQGSFKGFKKSKKNFNFFETSTLNGFKYRLGRGFIEIIFFKKILYPEKNYKKKLPVLTTDSSKNFFL